MQQRLRKGAIVFVGTLCLGAFGIGIANLANASEAPATASTQTSTLVPAQVHDVVASEGDEIKVSDDAQDDVETAAKPDVSDDQTEVVDPAESGVKDDDGDGKRHHCDGNHRHHRNNGNHNGWDNHSNQGDRGNHFGNRNGSRHG